MDATKCRDWKQYEDNLLNQDYLAGTETWQVSPVSVTWNPQCGQTAIQSVQVNGDPTNAIVAGTNGTLDLYGCFGGLESVYFSTSGTVSGPSPSITAVGTPDTNSTHVRVSYSVPAGTGAGAWTLTAQSISSAGYTMQVTPSLPYITSISPNVWPAGSQSLPVTIYGAGFGGGFGGTAGSVEVNSVYVTLTPTSGQWSDGAINGTVSVSASDPGGNGCSNSNGRWLWQRLRACSATRQHGPGDKRSGPSGPPAEPSNHQRRPSPGAGIMRPHNRRPADAEPCL